MVNEYYKKIRVMMRVSTKILAIKKSLWFGAIITLIFLMAIPVTKTRPMVVVSVGSEFLFHLTGQNILASPLK